MQTGQNAKNYITWNDVNRLKSFLRQQTFQLMVTSSQYPYQQQISNSQITQISNITKTNECNSTVSNMCAKLFFANIRSLRNKISDLILTVNVLNLDNNT